MRLTRAEIDGFGCLRQFREDLASGLHIFNGPNEAGKSTLQRSIQALLYGFYEGDRARASENLARERDVPWDGAPYGGRLEYELEGGERYRVQRDFSDPDLPTTLWDLGTGRDVTAEFGRGRHGNVPFARRHLGMSKTVFGACAFVSQGELFLIADNDRVSPQEIGDTIVALADTARRDISAQSAIDHLDRVLREQVGGPRARTAPLPATRRRLEQAKGKLEEIGRVREAIAGDAAALDAATERLAGLQGEAGRTRYLLLHTEAADIVERLRELQTLDQEDERFRQDADDNKEFAVFPTDERDAVRQAWERICDLRERLDSDRPEMEGKREKLEGLSKRKDSLVHRQRELDYLRDYPVDRKATVDESVIAWRNAHAISEEAAGRLRAAELDQDQVEEFERLKAQVGGLTQDDIERLTTRPGAPSGVTPGVLAAVGRALAATYRWAWGRIVGVARWLLSRVRGRPSEGEIGEKTEPKEARGAPRRDEMTAEEASRILGLYWRFREIAPRVDAYFQEKQTAEQARSRENEAEEALREALRDMVDDVSDLEAAHRQVNQRAEQHRELISLEGQLASIEGEVTSLQEAIDRVEEDGKRLSRQEALLGEQLRQSTGEGELGDLVRKFEEGCRRKRAHDEANRTLREIRERRGLVLRGKSPGELEEEGRKAGTGIRLLLGESPSLEGAQSDASREELEASLGRHQAAVHQCEVQIAELRTTIGGELARLRPRADVEEDLERYRRQAAVLERFGGELQVAIEVMEQAMTEAHRDFAPSVGRFLGEGLARVTGHRYNRVFLDPSTLRLATEVPETRRLEDIGVLSRGTRAAAYLLLRVGLAQHMSSMGEPVPLILDDPLVDLDDVRVENFLDLLLDLSRQVQILLFTKDEATKGWFEREGCDGESHRITLLPAPGS